MRLTRPVVLRAALTLLDEVGLDALTMRRLAAALGVQPGALYWHFADKQALNDAMAEEIFRAIPVPPPSGPWDAQLADFARGMLSAALRHRDGARLMSQMLAPGPVTLQLVERMLEILAEGGLAGRTGLWASAVVGSYVMGHALDVEGMRRMQPAGLGSMIRTLKPMLDAESFPQLLGVVDELPGTFAGGAIQERFEFGLRVVLDGLRAIRPPGRAGPRRVRKVAGRPRAPAAHAGRSSASRGRGR